VIRPSMTLTLVASQPALMYVVAGHGFRVLWAAGGGPGLGCHDCVLVIRFACPLGSPDHLLVFWLVECTTGALPPRM
jgi:hypothetical protein